MILIRTCPWHAERYAWARELQAQLPGAELIEDTTHSVLDTGLRALQRLDGRDGLLLEDDIILTSRFQQKLDWLVRSHPGVLISGFSKRTRRSADWMPGNTFFSALCLYFPWSVADGFSRWMDNEQRYRHWRHLNEDKGVRGGSFDTPLRQYLGDHGLRYWLAVPNLVQHRNARSVIRPGRPRNRISVTYEP
jgi:hypothetical protein